MSSSKQSHVKKKSKIKNEDGKINKYDRSRSPDSSRKKKCNSDKNRSKRKASSRDKRLSMKIKSTNFYECDDSMEEFLEVVGCENYSDLFKEKNITFEILIKMNEEELKQIGVSKFGARRRISLGIKELNDIQEEKTTISTPKKRKSKSKSRSRERNTEDIIDQSKDNIQKISKNKNDSSISEEKSPKKKKSKITIKNVNNENENENDSENENENKNKNENENNNNNNKIDKEEEEEIEHITVRKKLHSRSNSNKEINENNNSLKFCDNSEKFRSKSMGKAEFSKLKNKKHKDISEEEIIEKLGDLALPQEVISTLAQMGICELPKANNYIEIGENAYNTPELRDNGPNNNNEEDSEKEKRKKEKKKKRKSLNRSLSFKKFSTLSKKIDK